MKLFTSRILQRKLLPRLVTVVLRLLKSTIAMTTRYYSYFCMPQACTTQAYAWTSPGLPLIFR